MRRLVATLTLAVSATLLISGCAHHPRNHGHLPAQGGPSLCEHDPFLMRYNCSIERVERSAMQGDPDAQYALGYMYYYGVNTVRDQDLAYLWIKRAASQGQPLARQALRLIQHTETSVSNEEVPMNHQQSYPLLPAQSNAQSSLPSLHRQKPTQKPVISALHRQPKAQHDYVAHIGHVPSSTTMRAMESYLMKQPSQHYTLQLMGNHHLSTIQQFIQQHRLGPAARYYHAQFNGKPWYMLVYGQYDSLASAHAAMKKLPRSITRLHPWIKPNRAVKKEIKTRQIAV